MNPLPSWTRFWWVLPIGALLAWGLILRAEKASLAADLLAEQNAHQASIAHFKAATLSAQLIDIENARLAEERQAEESRRINDDFEARIADARARAAAAGVRAQASATDQGGRDLAAVPGIPDPARSADEEAGQDRLPSALSAADALIATEQAIQLDELINWVAAQANISISQKDKSGE